MFAVIKTGGKQYRVAAQDIIKVDKIDREAGDIVEFGEVLLLGGDNLSVGTPTVAGACVAGQVLQHTRGDKVIAFKKRRRKNSRRKRGYRHDFTVIRITEILTDGQKPSQTAAKAEKPVRAKPEPAVEADAEAAPKPAKAAKAKAAKPKAEGEAKPAAEKKPRAKKPKSDEA
jgi:large subunit ribosomal protein L21